MPSPKAWDILHNEALSRGLIGHWKLNAQTGASVNIAQDSGPNGLHGLVEAFNRSTGNPIPLPTIVSGKIRSAYDFEAGVSSTEHQRVNLSNGALVRPAHISISAWVWLDPDSTHRADDFFAEIVSNYRAEDSPSNGFLLRHRAPTPYRWQFNIFAGSPSTVGLAQADHTPTFNTWYHTVGTYDGVYVRVYANGVLLNTLLHPLGGDINYGTGPDVETWIAGYMGSTYLSGQVGVARGRIDEVTMWDRGLEPGEVAHLYNAGAGRFFDMKTAGWWDFNGTDAALRMDGKDAHVFDPADNTNDYTCLGVIEPDTWADVGKAYGIVMKWDNLAVIRQWSLYQTQNLGIVAASVTDGTTTSSVQSTTNVVIGDENFVGARYEYSGTPGTSSALDVYCRDNKESISNAAGPINNPTDVDIQLADGDNSAYDAFFDGKIYWLAYWNRKLTDQEVEDVRTGAVHPANLAPDFYWDGHQAVAGTYISERPDDPRYWEFDVEGTPTKGGSALETLPVPIGNVIVELPTDDLTMGFRTTQQKAGAQKVGRISVSETIENAPTLFHRVTAPRASALRRGLVSLLRFSRKRGR